MSAQVLARVLYGLALAAALAARALKAETDRAADRHAKSIVPRVNSYGNYPSVTHTHPRHFRAV